jgi:Tfp pilus assembly protein PilV
MRRTRDAQSGFIREVFWLAVVIGVVALVLLDALALFNNRQASYNNASAAAHEAQTVWVQTQSYPQAKLAAQQYLTLHGEKLVAFKTVSAEGNTSPDFVVTDTAHAKTYVFKYLAHVPGLKKWTQHIEQPVSTESTAD